MEVSLDGSVYKYIDTATSNLVKYGRTAVLCLDEPPFVQATRPGYLRISADRKFVIVGLNASDDRTRSPVPLNSANDCISPKDVWSASKN